MSTKQRGKQWLAATHSLRDVMPYVARLQTPEDSWTKRAAWQVSVPERLLASDGGEESVHWVLQKTVGSEEFHYLRVPLAFLRENRAAFPPAKDGFVAITLSAEGGRFFELRLGNSPLDFAPFAVPEPASDA